MRLTEKHERKVENRFVRPLSYRRRVAIRPGEEEPMSQHKVPGSLDYCSWEYMDHKAWLGAMRKFGRARGRARRDGRDPDALVPPPPPSTCEDITFPDEASSSSGEDSDGELEPVFEKWRAVQFGEHSSPGRGERGGDLLKKFNKSFVEVLEETVDRQQQRHRGAPTRGACLLPETPPPQVQAVSSSGGGGSGSSISSSGSSKGDVCESDDDDELPEFTVVDSYEAVSDDDDDDDSQVKDGASSGNKENSGGDKNLEEKIAAAASVIRAIQKSSSGEGSSKNMRKPRSTLQQQQQQPNLTESEEAEILAAMDAADRGIAAGDDESGAFSSVTFKKPPTPEVHQLKRHASVGSVRGLMEGLAPAKLTDLEVMVKGKGAVRHAFIAPLFTPSFKISDKKYFTARIAPCTAQDSKDVSQQKQFFLHAGDLTDVVKFYDTFSPVIPLSSGGVKRLLLLNRRIARFERSFGDSAAPVAISAQKAASTSPEMPRPAVLEEQIVAPSGNLGSVKLEFELFQPTGKPLCNFVFRHWKNPPYAKQMTFAECDKKEFKISFVPKSLEFLMHNIFPIVREWQEMVGLKESELMERFEVPAPFEPSGSAKQAAFAPNVSFEYGIQNVRGAPAAASSQAKPQEANLGEK